MLKTVTEEPERVSIVRKPAGPPVTDQPAPIDATDARVLLELSKDARATVMTLSQRLNLARNTVHARVNRLEGGGALRSMDTRVEPATLGYPIAAIVLIVVTQRRLAQVSSALAEIPEVLEVFGISGPIDLLARVVAKDADDLYRVAGQILSLDGVERTDTSLVMRRLVDYRIAPLIRRRAGG